MEGGSVPGERMAVTSYQIDPAHTFLGFAARHLAISKVKGRFMRCAGVLEIDWDDLIRSRARLRIETNSIETGNAERDAHLRSPDFLDVERFPEMVFRSTELVRESGADFRVSGPLLLHGVAKHVALEIEYGGKASDLNGTERVGLIGRGTIDRRDFGLRWNRSLEGGVLLVGHDIDLDLAIQGVRVP